LQLKYRCLYYWLFNIDWGLVNAIKYTVHAATQAWWMWMDVDAWWWLPIAIADCCLAFRFMNEKKFQMSFSVQNNRLSYCCWIRQHQQRYQQITVVLRMMIIDYIICFISKRCELGEWWRAEEKRQFFKLVNWIFLETVNLWSVVIH
jgi:hypothetical protein